MIFSPEDYYPFGMLMPGRTYSAGSSYRYGFNGKENDNEVKGEGNQQDYGMRIYDPRLGRFLSVDPLIKHYPNYTPYSYAGNKPIKFVDLDGAEENKHWYDYTFSDLMSWLGDPDNPLEDDGFIHKAATSANRTFNPWYNAASVIFGESNLSPSSDNVPMTRAEAGMNLLTQAMFWKYARIGSMESGPAQIEAQMTKNAIASSSKSATQKAAIGLTNEERQKIINWLKQQSSTGASLKVPQGMNEETFKVMSQRIANRAGNISTNVVVQGSRAAGTASAASDLDIAIKVSANQFDELVKKAFGNPKVGTAKWKTMQYSINNGIIQTGEAKLRDLRDNLQKLTGMNVQVSIVKEGGKFDNGAQIPVRAAVPGGVR